MAHGLTTNSTSLVVSIVEVLGRKFVVKKIVKKLQSDGSIRTYYYVYEQYREGKKVVTKYIGSLEEIVKFYIQYNHIR